MEIWTIASAKQCSKMKNVILYWNDSELFLDIAIQK